MRDNPPELLEFQNDAWICIGSKMLSWGCVRNSEAINTQPSIDIVADFTSSE